MKRTEISGAKLKVVLLAMAAGAVLVGLALPVPNNNDARATESRFTTLDLG